ncbi:MAG: hypothetical protein RLW62_17150 [Gammaproteobacteria bacterium]
MTETQQNTRTAHGFVDALTSYSRQHQAQQWSGDFRAFMSDVLPADPARVARLSHEYMWDMLCWQREHGGDGGSLFEHELFGI